MTRKVLFVASFALTLALMVAGLALHPSAGGGPSAVIANTQPLSAGEQSPGGFSGGVGSCNSIGGEGVKVTRVIPQQGAAGFGFIDAIEVAWDFVPQPSCLQVDHFEVTVEITRRIGPKSVKKVEVSGLARNAIVKFASVPREGTVKAVVVAVAKVSSRGQKEQGL
ncbi:MAG TPA: hypothetical protein VNO70_08605 [Blastocatellia bacterium]|nr:hypothetical protein [Blastocatellia bacterium]